MTVNVYAGGKLTGEVSGEGEVTINVYDGGEYVGSYAVNENGEGDAAPVLGSFDDYLINCWATGSMTWTENRAQQYVSNIEPQILESSAACLVREGASGKPYDPASYNPSENSVDLSLLNVGGAHGFTVEEIFGGSSGAPSGKSDDFGGSNGGSSGHPSGTPPEGWPGEKPEGRPEERPEGTKPPSTENPNK